MASLKEERAAFVSEANNARAHANKANAAHAHAHASEANAAHGHAHASEANAAAHAHARKPNMPKLAMPTCSCKQA